MSTPVGPDTLELPILQLVDGQLREPADTLDEWLTHPDTGERIGRQRASSPESVEAALAAAERVHAEGAWMRLPVAERAAVMGRFSAELAALADQIGVADSIDSGVPLSSTRAFAAGMAQYVGGVSEQAAALLYAEVDSSRGAADQYWLPWGPAAVFVPWNAPAAVALQKAASALAVGAPVIIKPSEWAPHSASLIGRAAVAAGVPAGVLQILQGGAAVGDSIAADPRIRALSYTGGLAGGKAVARHSAELMRPVDLELSGCNPVVVLGDADVEEAATAIAGAMQVLNGQWCGGPGRVFAPRSMVGPLSDAILAVHERGTVVGAATDEKTTLGPIAYEPHLKRLQQQLASFAAGGATVRTAGVLPESGGHFMLPTVVTDPPADLNSQEVFGPVVTISGYDTVEDAIRQANDHQFGLTAYVLTEDRDAGREVGRQLRAAYVYINDIGLYWLVPDMTVSMWGNSGVGTVNPSDTYRFYTGARFVG